MKSIKLKLVSLVIVLFSVFIGGYSQNTIPLEVVDENMFIPDSNWQRRLQLLEQAQMPEMESTRVESLKVHLDVTSNPVEFTVKTESLDKNEALQQMLECENEQTDALNQNLSNLNQTIKRLPYENIAAKQSVLDMYNINPERIDRLYRLSYNIWYSGLLIYLLLILYLTIKNEKLYWTKKNRWNTVAMVTLGIFILGYLMPRLCIMSIDNYHLWSNLDKLF